ncbi:MAG: hypothetical protein Q9187_008738 [Circinaria calcarea]
MFITCSISANPLGKIIKVPKFLTLAEQEDLRISLMGAIERKDFEKVKDAVVRGADVNSLSHGGEHCLSRAAINQLEDAVQFLLARGSNPNFQPGELPPLYYAARQGETSILRALLDHDDHVGFVPSPELNDSMFRTAAKGGHVDVARMILDRRTVRIDSKNQYEETALQEAASRGHTAFVKLLLDREADSGKGTDRFIALVKALKGGHLETAKALCEHGKINLNAQDKYGNTALLHAAELGDSRNYKQNAEEMVKFLLDLGANPSLVGNRQGPLHKAVLRGYDKIVKLLLQHGADPTIPVNFTPLMKAAECKEHKMVSLLLQVDIPDSVIRDKYLGDALRYAAKSGLRETVLSVLQVDASIINSTDSNETTPLLLAIQGTHMQTARLLVRHGARQDMPDRDGRLPLLLAAEKGYDLLVRDLLRSCESPDLKNSVGDTPLCLAAANGHEKTVQHLLGHGANPEMANRFGETPLDLAEERNHEKVMELLTAPARNMNPDCVMRQKQ